VGFTGPLNVNSARLGQTGIISPHRSTRTHFKDMRCLKGETPHVAGFLFPV